MKNTISVATVAALLPLAAVTRADKAWAPYLSSTSTLENGAPIVAWNGQFVVARDGVQTTVTCPTYDPGCSAENTTIISGLEANGGVGELWMGVLQQGGQKAYWHQPPRNSFMYDYSTLISYTAASNGDDAGVPVHEVVGDLFEISNTTRLNGPLDSVGLNKLWPVYWDTNGTKRYHGWGTCTVGTPGNYYERITVGGGKYCTPVDIEVREINLPAPQYYNCDGCELRTKTLDALPACKYPFCGDSAVLYS